MIKYTPHFLRKLEDLFAETDYILRYEKGNFKSGYCLLKDTKVVVVNKYFPLEGRINALIDILQTAEINVSQLSEKHEKLFQQLQQTDISSLSTGN